LLTRENLFAAEEIPYDYEPVKKAHFMYCEERRKAGQRAYCIPRELYWHRFEQRHGQIDRLAGVSEDRRSPRDTVRPECLRHLKSILDEWRDIQVFVDKNVAHAATPASRAYVNADTLAITLSHLWSAHEAICNVTSFVSIYLLAGSLSSFLAIPQYDQFAYLDRPHINQSNLGELERVWKDYQEEASSWGRWGLDGLEARMSSHIPPVGH
jgi:hypothetical protein